VLTSQQLHSGFSVNFDFICHFEFTLSGLNYEEYKAKGSGWNLKEITNLHVHIFKYTPLKGSSYIELPNWLKNTKSIINIKNDDDKCFLWSVLKALHPIENHPERINDLERYKNEINVSNISFPVTLSDIPKFEKQNNILNQNTRIAFGEG
jgi:hypothetical protein